MALRIVAVKEATISQHTSFKGEHSDVLEIPPQGKKKIIDKSRCQAHNRLFCFALKRCLRELLEEWPETLVLRLVPGYSHASTLQDFLRHSNVISDERPVININDPASWRTRNIIFIDTVRQDLPPSSTIQIGVNDTVELQPKPFRCSYPQADRDYIDPILFRSWREQCDKHHGTEGCLKMIIGRNISPCWLIDVEKMFLVSGSGHIEDYVALSYAWGQITMLTTTSKNLGLLQEKATLKRLSGDIPRTIRHAMDVVAMLGERYLWVDSLCIVQDDKDSLHCQLGNMAPIYENTALTIIAADGNDADFGIRGLRACLVQESFRPCVS